MYFTNCDPKKGDITLLYVGEYTVDNRHSSVASSNHDSHNIKYNYHSHENNYNTADDEQ